MFTAPLQSHHLGKQCPGAIVLTASLRPFRKSPYHPPAMRRKIHLQVKITSTLVFFNFLIKYCISVVVMFFSWQALVCQRVLIPLFWQLFLKTFVERCCKISLASGHPPVLLLPQTCLLLLHLYWEDRGLQRSAPSSWQLCHPPSRRR